MTTRSTDINIAGLADALNRACVVRLVGLVAPDGSGKTTSVRAWVSESAHNAHWLNASTLQGRSLDKLRDQLEALPASTLVIVDDAERLLQSAECDGVLSHLLDWPLECKFLLLTASEGGLSRIRNLRTKEVRLVQWREDWPSLPEAELICEGLGLPRAWACGAWRKICAGWAMGLHLLSEHKGKKSDPQATLSRCIHQYLYTAIESIPSGVLAALKLCAASGGSIRASLLAAHCPDVDMALARQAVACSAGFVQTSQDDTDVLCIHPLLQRVLVEDITAELGLVAVNEIRLSAADILRREGKVIEATALLALAGFESCAVQLLSEVWQNVSVAERYSMASALKTRHADDKTITRVLAHAGLCMPSCAKQDDHAVCDEPADKGTAFREWAIKLSQIQYGPGVNARILEYLNWFEHHASPSAPDPQTLNTRALCSLAALRILTQPGRPQTGAAIDAAVRSLTAHSRLDAPLGHVAMIAYHKYLTANHVKLGMLRAWWSVVAPSMKSNPEAERFHLLLDAMIATLDGRSEVCAAAITQLLELAAASGGPADHEVFVLAMGGWTGLQILQQGQMPLSYRGRASMDALCGRIDTGAIWLLGYADRALLESRLDAMTVHSLAQAADQGTLPLVDIGLRLAQLQAHAALGDPEKSMELANSVLSTIDSMPDLQCVTAIARLVIANCNGSPAPTEVKATLLHPCLQNRGLPQASTASLERTVATVTTRAPRPATEPAHAPADPASLPPDSTATHWVDICTFGTFSIELTTAEGVRKSVEISNKLAYFFQAIIFNGLPRPVSVEALSDEMWPNADGDSAKSNFDSSIHRLRRALGSHDCVIVKHGQVLVNRAVCNVDVYRVNDMLQHSPDRMTKAEAIECARELALHLKGPLVASEQPILTARKVARHVDGLLLLFVSQLAQRLVMEGELERAASVLACYVERVAFDKELFVAWMKVLEKLGRTDLARSLTRRFGDTDAALVYPASSPIPGQAAARARTSAGRAPRIRTGSHSPSEATSHGKGVMVTLPFWPSVTRAPSTAG
ncbi:MAG: hypothetical protein Q7U75_07695 [Desulfobacterales bacterium]|nr:hypothetical protein [Desulfobacterales bacterium]